MQRYVDARQLPGLVTLVSRNGDIQVEVLGNLSFEGAEPMQRDSIFRIASMTKPIAAAAAMILVEECRLRLDEPVDKFLPELADRNVLKNIDGALDDTVSARTPITLRHLLTMQMGLGYLMESPPDIPILEKLKELNLLQGPPQPQLDPDPDEWIRRVGTLPLMYQPGEKWMYDISMGVLGVLISRVSGQSLEVFLQERLFGPLRMKDTSFSVPPSAIHRLATSYTYDESGALVVFDAAVGGQWSTPPRFHSATGGLVSTADDYLAFGQMMLNFGQYGDTRILSRHSVELMTSNQISPRQIADSRLFLGEGSGWGFGMATTVRKEHIWSSRGRFGWDGGLGTSAAMDPLEGLIGILLTQCAWTSPTPPTVSSDFWTSVYSSLD